MVDLYEKLCVLYCGREGVVYIYSSIWGISRLEGPGSRLLSQPIGCLILGNGAAWCRRRNREGFRLS
jgi:hypothetical protein